MGELIKYQPNWKASEIRQNSSFRDALAAISQSGSFMACVTEAEGHLIGIVTDSDIRRALLSGANLSDTITSWIQRNPVAGIEGQTTEELLEIAKCNGVREIPILDADGRLTDIFVLLIHQERQSRPHSAEYPLGAPSDAILPNPMLLLAGGMGTRLRSVVKDKPKPLALVGDKPIIQTIIFNAMRSGIRKFYVSVNYLAEQIKDHLTSQIYQDVEIEIIEEQGRLGTAGSIAYIADRLKVPLIVSNADILTNLPLELMVRQHTEQKSDITCAVRKHETVVPFGVFEIAAGKIQRIVEKPKIVHLINSGIYVIEPAMCARVPRNVYYDMPSLIQLALDENKTVTPFLVHEYWKDIGRPDDFHTANQEYGQHFGVFNDVP